MLYFNLCFTENPSIDAHICEGMTQVIQDFMDTMLDHSIRAYDRVLPDGNVTDVEHRTPGEHMFITAYRKLYPSWYPEENMFTLFTKLYVLIKDETAHVPDLEMEYLLASIINVMIAQNDDALIWGYRLSSEDILVLMQELKDTFDVDYELMEEIKNYQVPSSLWLECCFLDADYEMLDVMDMETLLASDLNMRMGIIDDSESYAVTGNWWDNSGRLVKE